MKTFHFILQAKGGVGKSFFAYLQALKYEQDTTVLFVDVDNSTQTSTQQLSFLRKDQRVAQINLFNERDKQDRQRLPDLVIELSKQKFTTFFMDFGAPESEQFPAMLRQDFPASLLKQVETYTEAEFVFHCIIAGNTAFKACMEYLVELANQLHPFFTVNVHLNEHTLVGPSAKEQKKTLVDFCHSAQLPIAEFGNIDAESDVGKQIVHNVQTGKGLAEYGFIEQLQIHQVLEKLR